MGNIAEVCENLTLLEDQQVQELEKISAFLDFAADLAHAHAMLYVRSQMDRSMILVAQAKPNTNYVEHRESIIGTVFHAIEEPIIWRTFGSGRSISGLREWELGMDVLQMRTYPLLDRKGQIIGVVSFEYSSDEQRANAYDMLVETAYWVLVHCNPQYLTSYRSLTSRDGIVLVGDRGHTLYANAVAASIFKVMGVGRLIARRIYDRNMKMKLVHQAMLTAKPQDQEVEFGNLILMERAIPIVADDKVLRTIFIVTDITEVKQKEKELLIKSAVIQEIHHRVKNNLQTIASLLRLQARRSSSAEVKGALRECINRILSISVIHESLSQQDVEVIDVAEAARNIVDSVIQNMVEPSFLIETHFQSESMILPSDKATSLALAINELLLNSIEHGFEGRSEGRLDITMERRDQQYRIEIADDGVGLPENFSKQGLKSLGIQIITTLIETDLAGQFQLFSAKGTRAIITIPMGGK